MITLSRKHHVILFCTTLLIVILLVQFSSEKPDGLEHQIEANFPPPNNETWSYRGLFPDYTIPWLTSTFQSKALAGVAGALMVFIAIYSVKFFRMSRKQEKKGA